MNSPQSRPAPYGHACANCSRVKCKCIYIGDGHTCERCHRLKKECQPAVPGRKRNVKKPGGSRTAVLEEKLEDLVSILREQATARSGAVAAPESSRERERLDQDGGEKENNLLDSESEAMPPASAPTGVDSTNSSSSLSIPSPRIEIPSHIAEESLSIFRTSFLPFFPFIHIPSSITAQPLHNSRPFLWLCIICITFKTKSQQKAFAEQIRQTVTQRVVTKNERSVDLLLGIICFAGWIYYHKHDRAYITMLTNLATVLVFDLGLNKPPAGDSGKTVWAPAKQNAIIAHERTMEERRAVLSVFLITSTASMEWKRTDTLRWTTHMEASLRFLIEQHECEGDMILVTQVKCHLLIEQSLNCPALFGENGNAELSRAVLKPYVKALQSQLQEIKRSLPSEITQNATVKLFLHSTELIINESALNQTLSFSGAPDFQTLEGLYTCLQSIDSWFNIFFAISPSSNIGLSWKIFHQLSHSLISLFQLTTLRDPFWDRDAVIKTIDVFAVLERLAESMEKLPTLAGLVNDNPPDEDVFTKSSKTMRALKTNWETEMAAAQLSALSESGIYGSGTVQDDLTLSLINDQWFPDIFAS